jgi:hypothetical protein
VIESCYCGNIPTTAIWDSFKTMNWAWLFDPDDHLDDWSRGFSTFMFEGWYDAECDDQESISYVSVSVVCDILDKIYT